MPDVVYLDLVTGERFNGEDVGTRPVPADMPGVAGVFVGGCVATGPGRLRHPRHPVVNAHAHTSSGPHKGWICFRAPRLWNDPEHDWLRWHEYAHIVTGEGHTERWRQAMRQLGQPIPDRYAPRRRIETRRRRA